MITIRMERVNSEVQKALGEIIQYQLKDPRKENCIISVLKAEVTKDMKNCKAYISVMPYNKGKDIVNLLKSCEPFIRRKLVELVKLRNAPSINFVLDDSEEYSSNIERLIKEIHKNDENIRETDNDDL